MKDPFTGDLFSTESNLRVKRITPHDVRVDSDKLRVFSELISEHEPMYPNIRRWVQSKVLPGIKSKERMAYIGLNNDEPIVSAVLKCGKDTKFCHLHIDEAFKGNHLGELFFAMMALDARHLSRVVHFTLPESLWTEKKGFFQSFGFLEASKTITQYRGNETEFRCSASFDVVWGRVLEKLPKIISTFTKSRDIIFSGLLMSFKPEYIEKMQSGEKVVEVRRKFNPKWTGCRIALYSSSPDQVLHGYASVEYVRKDAPDRIWVEYETSIGCSKEEFDKYTNSCDYVYAIGLKNYESYRDPIVLEQMSWLLGKDLKPPQSYISLAKNKPWVEAISVAELLHGRFRLYTPVI